MKALFILLLTLAIFGTAGLAIYHLFILPEKRLQAEKAQPPPPPPPDLTLPEYARCVSVLQSGDLLAARTAFELFLEQYPHSSRIEEARDQLGRINVQLFFSPVLTPEKTTYIVQKGDVLTKVAARLKTSSELLLRMNRLESPRLLLGQKLVSAQPSFSLTIARNSRKVTLLETNRFFRQYPILRWPGGPAERGAANAHPVHATSALPKLAGKVTEKIAWSNGSRISLVDKRGYDATYWILINIPACSLHSAGGDNSPRHTAPPGGGPVLSESAMSELAVLLEKGDNVILEN